jgi:hypothetical protein
MAPALLQLPVAPQNRWIENLSNGKRRFTTGQCKGAKIQQASISTLRPRSKQPACHCHFGVLEKISVEPGLPRRQRPGSCSGGANFMGDLIEAGPVHEMDGTPLEGDQSQASPVHKYLVC